MLNIIRSKKDIEELMEFVKLQDEENPQNFILGYGSSYLGTSHDYIWNGENWEYWHYRQCNSWGNREPIFMTEEDVLSSLWKNRGELNKRIRNYNFYEKEY